MDSTSSKRFNSIASGYATSEVHSGSPTLDRLHTLLPYVDSVCDVASGAGHTGLGFAGIASRIVAVDPAPNMLAEVRRLATERGVSVETVEAFAELIPLASTSFDLVVCRLAAHHFSDLPKAMSEMTRLAKPGGYVAIIDMEGDENPTLDALNHEIEVLHDPTHVRSYAAKYWRELFTANGLEVEACENRCWEISGGLTVKRWCELGDSGDEAFLAIQDRLASASSEELSELEITRDTDGGFRLPIRTLLILGRKSDESRAKHGVQDDPLPLRSNGRLSSTLCVLNPVQKLSARISANRKQRCAGVLAIPLLIFSQRFGLVVTGRSPFGIGKQTIGCL